VPLPLPLPLPLILMLMLNLPLTLTLEYLGVVNEAKVWRAGHGNGDGHGDVWEGGREFKIQN